MAMSVKLDLDAGLGGCGDFVRTHDLKDAAAHQFVVVEVEAGRELAGEVILVQGSHLP